MTSTDTKVVEPVVADVEKAVTPPATDVGSLELQTDKEEEAQPDPLLVTWDGDNDPENPYNWRMLKKMAITILLSFGGLVTLMSGAMLAPALQDIAHDFETDEEHAQIFLSIYVLAFAFGPMVLAPCTEVFGRRPVWIICACYYIIWNTAAGFSKSSGVLILCRIMSGLGASAEFAVTNPVLADIWTSDQRGKSYAISTFLPLLGPALGPIVGGAVTQTVGWRWIFWILSIFDGALVLAGLFFLPETFRVTLLDRKAAKLRKETGQAYYTASSHEALSARLTRSLTRPVRMLCTHPTIQFMGILLAYNFGLLYIVLSTFALLWIDRYGQSKLIGGLHYLALVIGYTLASQVGGKVMDKTWAYLKKRAGGTKTAPEYRVPLMVPGAILVLVGIFTYGWTAEYRTHWIGPDIGIAIFGCGIILNTQAMQAYVTEAYLGHVASASAASQFLRSVTGFAFPIFAPALYNALGYGWGNSVLGFAFLAFAAPAPIVLWKFGARMRAKSTNHD
ncbi:Putative Major facilitator superfamily transporter [[Torrubiella] hemipterigena]|uniref:Putative Major facilitator superfamily transporter n=1 Tax=[Torrubiella] hemipterigena TaxID=1531966 RepID=A0A0A1TDL3_9HYPO|nr:Putative Major facilitator superfamily transporter [[Torrubiella] hemipterigena]